ncbi:MAG TPA: quinol:cytochrome C oxidoreductase [Planctomycetes bacterium]|nr:quinol:cytochrome C oxidoreductase [Planctomycetota bacterium]HIN80274.1 quinol:cytochrome C oxidoreductase [Planctomycetota bacterium]
MAHTPIDITTENRSLGTLASGWITAGALLAVIGVLGTLLLGNLEGAFEDLGPAHHSSGTEGAAAEGHSQGPGGHGESHGFISEWSIYHPYLVSACFFLTITLGALFFVLVHHITRAGWSTALRRIAEGISRNFVLMLILFIPILMPGGMDHLYKWLNPDPGDALIGVKESYLNYDWFLIRIAAYFVIWIGVSTYFHRKSVAQDSSGDESLTVHLGALSPVAVILFALSITFAAFDLLMSLDAHWFSTIFGVYIFAGSVLSFHAVLALTVLWLQSRGRLTRAVTPEHLQDVGKMMFAFTVFWAYIAFSQYMLIWYANIPEETVWYLRRQSTWLWGFWGWLMVLGHFLVPFLFLLSRHIKRRKTTLVVGAIWVLAMHWCDMYYLVMPQINGGGEFPFRMLDVTILIAMGGLYLIGMALALRGNSLVAEGDPKLPESLVFENV